MKEKFEKETLTRKIIKKDAKIFLWYNILNYFLYAVLFSLVVLSWHLLFLFSDISRQMLNISTITAIVIIFAIFSIAIARYFKMILKLRKDRFDIVIDKAYDMRDAYRVRGRSGGAMAILSSKPILPFGIFRGPIDLYFTKYKKYIFPFGMHYNFSEKNKYDYYQMVSSSKIGDEFYLLIINNRIVEIYNTKLFELRE